MVVASSDSSTSLGSLLDELDDKDVLSARIRQLEEKLEKEISSAARAQEAAAAENGRLFIETQQAKVAHEKAAEDFAQEIEDLRMLHRQKDESSQVTAHQLNDLLDLNASLFKQLQQAQKEACKGVEVSQENTLLTERVRELTDIVQNLDMELTHNQSMHEQLDDLRNQLHHSQEQLKVANQHNGSRQEDTVRTARLIHQQQLDIAHLQSLLEVEQGSRQRTEDECNAKAEGQLEKMNVFKNARESTEAALADMHAKLAVATAKAEDSRLNSDKYRGLSNAIKSQLEKAHEDLSAALQDCENKEERIRTLREGMADILEEHCFVVHILDGIYSTCERIANELSTLSLGSSISQKIDLEDAVLRLKSPETLRTGIEQLKRVCLDTLRGLDTATPALLAMQKLSGLFKIDSVNELVVHITLQTENICALKGDNHTLQSTVGELTQLVGRLGATWHPEYKDALVGLYRQDLRCSELEIQNNGLKEQLKALRSGQDTMIEELRQDVGTLAQQGEHAAAELSELLKVEQKKVVSLQRRLEDSQKETMDLRKQVMDMESHVARCDQHVPEAPAPNRSPADDRLRHHIQNLQELANRRLDEITEAYERATTAETSARKLLTKVSSVELSLHQAEERRAEADADLSACQDRIAMLEADVLENRIELKIAAGRAEDAEKQLESLKMTEKEGVRVLTLQSQLLNAQATSARLQKECKELQRALACTKHQENRPSLSQNFNSQSHRQLEGLRALNASLEVELADAKAALLVAEGAVEYEQSHNFRQAHEESKRRIGELLRGIEKRDAVLEAIMLRAQAAGLDISSEDVAKCLAHPKEGESSWLRNIVQLCRAK